MLEWRLDAYRRWRDDGRADVGEGVVPEDRF
jgi:hypothetical protein